MQRHSAVSGPAAAAAIDVAIGLRGLVIQRSDEREHHGGEGQPREEPEEDGAPHEDEEGAEDHRGGEAEEEGAEERGPARVEDGRAHVLEGVDHLLIPRGEIGVVECVAEVHRVVDREAEGDEEGDARDGVEVEACEGHDRQELQVDAHHGEDGERRDEEWQEDEDAHGDDDHDHAQVGEAHVEHHVVKVAELDAHVVDVAADARVRPAGHIVHDALHVAPDVVGVLHVLRERGGDDEPRGADDAVLVRGAGLERLPPVLEQGRGYVAAPGGEGLQDHVGRVSLAADDGDGLESLRLGTGGRVRVRGVDGGAGTTRVARRCAESARQGAVLAHDVPA
mmetsp:Transcript_20368/g.60099  ORF Transcript_20368/g.60099 Transcript_20368/m.60099 type:complete len:337 (+) Transcript_20368:170-1180(+)